MHHSINNPKPLLSSPHPIPDMQQLDLPEKASLLPVDSILGILPLTSTCWLWINQTPRESPDQSAPRLTADAWLPFVWLMRTHCHLDGIYCIASDLHSCWLTPPLKSLFSDKTNVRRCRCGDDLMVARLSDECVMYYYYHHRAFLSIFRRGKYFVSEKKFGYEKQDGLFWCGRTIAKGGNYLDWSIV